MDPTSRGHIKLWARLQGESQLSHDLIQGHSEIKVKQRKYFDPGVHVPTATTSPCLKRNNQIFGVFEKTYRPALLHKFISLPHPRTTSQITQD
jgi:hypothetical protein